MEALFGYLFLVMSLMFLIARSHAERMQAERDYWRRRANRLLFRSQLEEALENALARTGG